MLRMSVAWVCRGSLAAVLLGACATGAQAPVAPAQDCGAPPCSRAGTIRWQKLIPGVYIIHDDARGTVPVSGVPYAAVGRQVAVLGLGAAVTAYDARSGMPRWTAQLARLAPGAQIVSTRVWPGVVTAGVAATAGPRPARTGQTEAVLDARSGRLIRTYPSTPFGGTVAADARHTVVAGPGAVTSYSNASGQPMWSRPTGAAPQRWQLDGHYLYVTVAAGGYLGPQPVTALRRIDLRSGAQRIIRPRAPFAGMLSAALDGIALFSGSGGVTAYSEATGHRLWRLAGAVPQGVDLVQDRFYLSVGGTLAGVDRRGRVQSRLPGSAGLYGERGGVAFGLDNGTHGDAWGVDAASKRVVWSTGPLPWPHVFVDFGGLGGSADPRSSVIILAACGQVDMSVSPARCTKPELVAVSR